MRFLIVLCATIPVLQAVPVSKLTEIFREGCFEFENVPQEAIDKLRERRYDLVLGYEAQCFVRCMGLMTGIWNDYTGFDIERTYKYLNAEKLDVTMENLKKCLTVRREHNQDKCLWAAWDIKCLWTNAYVPTEPTINWWIPRE
ncbi:unnamed protein product [Hermetia illucens]|uniref:Uncharacterized protein n=1 Tax=Hermetia illucens TaxID=343691 RepID=A0A7R8YWD0_HERIL|nr:uncharacterized protein LOC119655156 [Hermetia illucens]CAD7087214.1 unnamed protein product [Hermetia illucens]